MKKFSIYSPSNQLIGDARANTIAATGAKDLISCLDGADTFLTSNPFADNKAAGFPILIPPASAAATSLSTMESPAFPSATMPSWK